ncbi:MAG: BlaI/MecI/CopY family transcriptional regulator [Saprospiraceae bacterium]|jgi:predicted transcriptional regulator|nr:BlaI/MecI/CopY family transcriptional regulator [Saprospiraceae bacterium]
MNRLTKGEEEIMQIIWELGPCTVSDVRDFIELHKGVPKPPHSSVSTIVRILEKKGFLDHKAYGRTYEYRPIVDKKSYTKFSLKKLVGDYFGGSMNQLVSFLVKENDLDTDELSDLLDQLDDDQK